MRARSALFTVFGDVVRPAGGEAWLTVLTDCMGSLGFTPEATRTALHRMTAEGWVAPRRSGRYASYGLTPKGVERLEEAAARIYRLRAVTWDGRWRLLVGRGVRRSTALARELQWMGFGRLAPQVWISPHDLGERTQNLLQRHGISDAHAFESHALQDDAAVVADAWPLGDLRRAHAEFIAHWSGSVPPTQPQAAFALRIRLVHHWRSFLFLDPGLPLALLPQDWLGHEAAGVFARLYEGVSELSWSFYDERVRQAPGQRHTGSPPPRRQLERNPFAAGLKALGNGENPITAEAGAAFASATPTAGGRA